MKKLFHAFFILNILCGLSMFINILFLYSTNSFSIPIMIGAIIFYITMIVLYFRKDIEVSKSDIVMLSIYAIFVIGYIIYMLIYQSNNSRTYSMLYYSELILLPNIIYCLYCVLKSD